MDATDRDALVRVLFAYEHLWIDAMKRRYLMNHPGSDPVDVREMLVDQAEELFHPLIDALRDAMPLAELVRDLLRTVDRPV